MQCPPSFILVLMMRVSSFCRLAGNLAILGCSLVFTVDAVSGSSAAAQRGPVQRTVQGKVTDKGEAGLNGAVVYLKDDHTLSVKSFISESDGGYRFGQLSANTDYELWAEMNGKKSPTKTISSFDSKNSFQMNLKIDTGK
ncbi:carboxypeptidase-like regulatory domain-containing protein [Granulicella arctica]|uniref:carboxypeptidase-like regulatory domain-containing protein n=1 Tax=Granulicella arctica TaxID=940613 RepID=UPI0021DF5EB9|nr:carboxypeptidase-like regulatory domain-containing protein [Granulicella arctica]